MEPAPLTPPARFGIRVSARFLVPSRGRLVDVPQVPPAGIKVAEPC